MSVTRMIPKHGCYFEAGNQFPEENANTKNLNPENHVIHDTSKKLVWYITKKLPPPILI